MEQEHMAIEAGQDDRCTLPCALDYMLTNRIAGVVAIRPSFNKNIQSRPVLHASRSKSLQSSSRPAFRAGYTQFFASSTGGDGAEGGPILVIVESPSKAKIIQSFLDSLYVVESCMGHVRDLPQSAKSIPPELKGRFGKVVGVDPDNQFEPLYVTLPGKEPLIKRLQTIQRKAKQIILATDEDREGEAISWHLLELLKPKVPVKRAVFHEITKDAITRSFQDLRSIDLNLVQAQETRRILDRLAGFTMSPLLWKKIARG
eukprot:754426-Hanusia_phi.AAC.5